MTVSGAPFTNKNIFPLSSSLTITLIDLRSRSNSKVAVLLNFRLPHLELIFIFSTKTVNAASVDSPTFVYFPSFEIVNEESLQ